VGAEVRESRVYAIVPHRAVIDTKPREFVGTENFPGGKFIDAVTNDLVGSTQSAVTFRIRAG
jgi:hypothetical protein